MLQSLPFLLTLFDRGDARGARLRVENIHYDLTEEDLDVCHFGDERHPEAAADMMTGTFPKNWPHHKVATAL